MIHYFALSSKNTSLAFIDQILFYKEQDQKDQIHLVKRCEQIKQSKKHSIHSYFLYPGLEGKRAISTTFWNFPLFSPTAENLEML